MEAIFCRCLQRRAWPARSHDHLVDFKSPTDPKVLHLVFLFFVLFFLFWLNICKHFRKANLKFLFYIFKRASSIFISKHFTISVETTTPSSIFYFKLHCSRVLFKDFKRSANISKCYCFSEVLYKDFKWIKHRSHEWPEIIVEVGMFKKSNVEHFE